MSYNYMIRKEKLISEIEFWSVTHLMIVCFTLYLSLPQSEYSVQHELIRTENGSVTVCKSFFLLWCKSFCALSEIRTGAAVYLMPSRFNLFVGNSVEIFIVSFSDDTKWLYLSLLDLENNFNGPYIRSLKCC